MKLKKAYKQPPVANLPGSLIEKWDIDGKYEIFIVIDTSACVISITQGKEDLTIPIARILGIKTDEKNVTFTPPCEDSELYLVMGIDCICIAYTKVEDYMNLLLKIETIIKNELTDQ